MDIEEFAKKVEPRAKRSRLAPFRAQILELKEKGFVAWQIRDWLETNGVKVTRQAVSQFIRQQEGDETPKRRAMDQAEKQNPPAAGLDKGSDGEVLGDPQDNPPAIEPEAPAGRGVRKRKKEQPSNMDYAEKFYAENSENKDILGNEVAKK